MEILWFRADNTDGYSDAERDALNNELAEKLAAIEPYSDDWYQVAKAFSDEVARR
jgi:hypothetical protein